MFLKEKIKGGLRRVGAMPLVGPVIAQNGVRRVLSKLPGSSALYGSGWERLHPFDREHGTDTSGVVPTDELKSSGDHPALAHVTVYGGSQPSVVRAALASLPAGLESCTFLDLGCGKGRPLIVASEFPFRDIVGVELSSDLARIARSNAQKIARRYPSRTAIRVEIGDATAFPIPSGNLVVFLYNAFDTELVLKVVRSLEAALAAEPRSLYVVLYNPVDGACFDASPVLARRFARMVPYAPEERGYGPDDADGVVIWQGGNVPPAPGAADAKIVVTIKGSRVEIV